MNPGSITGLYSSNQVPRHLKTLTHVALAGLAICASGEVGYAQSSRLILL